MFSPDPLGFSFRKKAETLIKAKEASANKSNSSATQVSQKVVSAVASQSAGNRPKQTNAVPNNLTNRQVSKLNVNDFDPDAPIPNGRTRADSDPELNAYGPRANSDSIICNHSSNLPLPTSPTSPSLTEPTTFVQEEKRSKLNDGREERKYPDRANNLASGNGVAARSESVRKGNSLNEDGLDTDFVEPSRAKELDRPAALESKPFVIMNAAAAMSAIGPIEAERERQAKIEAERGRHFKNPYVQKGPNLPIEGRYPPISQVKPNNNAEDDVQQHNLNNLNQSRSLENVELNNLNQIRSSKNIEYFRKRAVLETAVKATYAEASGLRMGSTVCKVPRQVQQSASHSFLAHAAHFQEQLHEVMGNLIENYRSLKEKKAGSKSLKETQALIARAEEDIAKHLDRIGAKASNATEITQLIKILNSELNIFAKNYLYIPEKSKDKNKNYGSLQLHVLSQIMGSEMLNPLRRKYAELISEKIDTEFLSNPTFDLISKFKAQLDYANSINLISGVDHEYIAEIKLASRVDTIIASLIESSSMSGDFSVTLRSQLNDLVRLNLLSASRCEEILSGQLVQKMGPTVESLITGALNSTDDFDLTMLNLNNKLTNFVKQKLLTEAQVTQLFDGFVEHGAASLIVNLANKSQEDTFSVVLNIRTKLDNLVNLGLLTPDQAKKLFNGFSEQGFQAHFERKYLEVMSNSGNGLIAPTIQAYDRLMIAQSEGFISLDLFHEIAKRISEFAIGVTTYDFDKITKSSGFSELKNEKIELYISGPAMGRINKLRDAGIITDASHELARGEMRDLFLNQIFADLTRDLSIQGSDLTKSVNKLNNYLEIATTNGLVKAEEADQFYTDIREGDTTLNQMIQASFERFKNDRSYNEQSVSILTGELISLFLLSSDDRAEFESRVSEAVISYEKNNRAAINEYRQNELNEAQKVAQKTSMIEKMAEEHLRADKEAELNASLSQLFTARDREIIENHKLQISKIRQRAGAFNDLLNSHSLSISKIHDNKNKIISAEISRSINLDKDKSDINLIYLMGRMNELNESIETESRNARAVLDQLINAREGLINAWNEHMQDAEKNPISEISGLLEEFKKTATPTTNLLNELDNRYRVASANHARLINPEAQRERDDSLSREHSFSTGLGSLSAPNGGTQSLRDLEDVQSEIDREMKAQGPYSHMHAAEFEKQMASRSAANYDARNHAILTEFDNFFNAPSSNSSPLTEHDLNTDDVIHHETVQMRSQGPSPLQNEAILSDGVFGEILKETAAVIGSPLVNGNENEPVSIQPPVFQPMTYSDKPFDFDRFIEEVVVKGQTIPVQHEQAFGSYEKAVHEKTISEEDFGWSPFQSARRPANTTEEKTPRLSGLDTTHNLQPKSPLVDATDLETDATDLDDVEGDSRDYISKKLEEVEPEESRSGPFVRAIRARIKINKELPLLQIQIKTVVEKLNSKISSRERRELQKERAKLENQVASLLVSSPDFLLEPAVIRSSSENSLSSVTSLPKQEYHGMFASTEPSSFDKEEAPIRKGRGISQSTRNYRSNAAKRLRAKAKRENARIEKELSQGVQSRSSSENSLSSFVAPQASSFDVVSKELPLTESELQQLQGATVEFKEAVDQVSSSLADLKELGLELPSQPGFIDSEDLTQTLQNLIALENEHLAYLFELRKQNIQLEEQHKVVDQRQQAAIQRQHLEEQRQGVLAEELRELKKNNEMAEQRLRAGADDRQHGLIKYNYISNRISNGANTAFVSQELAENNSQAFSSLGNVSAQSGDSLFHNLVAEQFSETRIVRTGTSGPRRSDGNAFVVHGDVINFLEGIKKAVRSDQGKKRIDELVKNNPNLLNKLNEFYDNLVRLEKSSRPSNRPLSMIQEENYPLLTFESGVESAPVDFSFDLRGVNITSSLAADLNESLSRELTNAQQSSLEDRSSIQPQSRRVMSAAPDSNVQANLRSLVQPMPAAIQDKLKEAENMVNEGFSKIKKHLEQKHVLLTLSAIDQLSRVRVAMLQAIAEFERRLYDTSLNPRLAVENQSEIQPLQDLVAGQFSETRMVVRAGQTVSLPSNRNSHSSLIITEEGLRNLEAFIHSEQGQQMTAHFQDLAKADPIFKNNLNELVEGLIQLKRTYARSNSQSLQIEEEKYPLLTSGSESTPSDIDLALPLADAGNTKAQVMSLVPSSSIPVSLSPPIQGRSPKRGVSEKQGQAQSQSQPVVVQQQPTLSAEEIRQEEINFVNTFQSLVSENFETAQEESFVSSAQFFNRATSQSQISLGSNWSSALKINKDSAEPKSAAVPKEVPPEEKQQVVSRKKVTSSQLKATLHQVGAPSSVKSAKRRLKKERSLQRLQEEFRTLKEQLNTPKSANAQQVVAAQKEIPEERKERILEEEIVSASVVAPAAEIPTQIEEASSEVASDTMGAMHVSNEPSAFTRVASLPADILKMVWGMVPNTDEI